MYEVVVNPLTMTAENRASLVCAYLIGSGLPKSVIENVRGRVRMEILWAERAEREACAKIAESHPYSPAQMNDGARQEIAEAIRKRATHG